MGDPDRRLGLRVVIRGVIEGFYGRLWTRAERLGVVDLLGEAGFTTYACAPKEDRRQNAGWRDGYPAEGRRELRELAERCASAGLELWMGIRPVGISYADEADAERLARTLVAHRELAAARVVLLADDIPASLEASAAGRFRTLAEAHAWLVDTVLERAGLDARDLVFVPTDYHGAGSPYLEHLAQAVPAEVDLCWTGSGVFAATITAQEAAAIGAVMGRPPLIWDNYPVNDEPDRHDLRIGPVRGRDAAMLREVRGVLVNPAMEPEISRVPLLTWGDLLRNPGAYDPEAAFQRALLRVTGDAGDAAAVAVIAAAFDRSVLDQSWQKPAPAALADAIERLPRLRNRRLAAELSAFVRRPPG